MAKQDYDDEIVPVNGQSISKSGISEVLEGIRPFWRGKDLIQRVERLLPVDPSSACQRLFNAAIHDLKAKIIVMGVDLAKEVAGNNRLPSVSRDEDVLEYNVSKTIDLAYHMGLLNRPEWRRIHRCYEIRRDLEHEDNEYEAVLEDCFYIFKTTIDVVLSKDPIELLRVTDVREVVEAPSLNVSEELLADYQNAPRRRKREINDMLISFAYDDAKPDIVRENSVELMRMIQPLTEDPVRIELAGLIEARIGRNGIDVKSAKIAYACGALAYFKKVKLKDFYNSLLAELKNSRGDWGDEGKSCQKIEDMGGLKLCPMEVYKDLLLQLVLVYLGERSYGYYSSSRPVFFSNSAAPVIKRLIKEDATRAGLKLAELREHKAVKEEMDYKPIARRFEILVDLTEEFEDE